MPTFNKPATSPATTEVRTDVQADAAVWKAEDQCVLYGRIRYSDPVDTAVSKRVGFGPPSQSTLLRLLLLDLVEVRRRVSVR